MHRETSPFSNAAHILIMIITFVCDVLGEENNGTTIATMNVAREMAKKGHEVRIVCPDAERKGQTGFYVVPRIHFGPFDGYVANNGVVLSSTHDMKTVEDAIKDADVVHFNFCGALSSKTIKLCKKLGIPTTASLHTQAENFTNQVFLQNAPWANHAMYHWLYKHLFRYVDAIHYPSEFIKDIFEKENKFHSNAYVISNGVKHAFHKAEVTRPEEYKGKFLILFTARYSKEKNHKVILKSMKYSKHADEIQWIFAGAGPLEKKFRRATKNWKNKPVLGFHPQEEMNSLVNMVDLYCHASTIDLEAISCLEALSVGICPLLSDSPRAAVRSYALSEHNLFNYRSPKSLAAGIDYWIEHPKERIEMGNKYLGYANRFNFESAMDKMEQMFKDVAAKKDKKNQ